MIIVDGQIHLWGKGTPSRSIARRPFCKRKHWRYGRGRYRPGAGPSGDVGSGFHEPAAQAAGRNPDRFAIMGWFYLDDPQRALLESWKGRPGMMGLRFYFPDPQSLT